MFKYTFLMGLLVLVCAAMTTAEDPKSEPESEPESEPNAKDEDSKHSGSSAAGKQVKGASDRNPASAPWAFSVPVIVTFVAVAKFIL